MQVGGNRVGMEARLIRRDRHVPVEAGLSEADIENDVALAALYHRRVELAILEQFLAVARKTVGVNIAGSKLVQKKGVNVAVLGNLTEIDHDRKVGGVSGLDRSID